MNKKTISIDEIRELALSVQLNNIQTLCLKNSGTTVKIKCSSQTTARQKPTKAKTQPIEVERNTINSTAVGILYLTHPVQDKPLISLGDNVKLGQIVAFIKMSAAFIPVKSEKDGYISKICLDTGSVVEFGQTIFEIE